jgi:hypothetical protein
MFAHARDEIVPRVPPMTESKEAMVTISFTGTRKLRIVYLPQRQKLNQEYFSHEILKGAIQESNQSTG